MLRWRLILGTLLIAGLAGLCWLDAKSRTPGIYLGPLAIVAATLCAGELLRMYRARGFGPSPWAVYVGAVVPVALSCAPILVQPADDSTPWAHLAWLSLGLALGLAMAFLCEMRRFNGAGQSIAHAALAVLAVLYIGGCLGAIVQLRFVRAASEPTGWRGMVPLLLVLVTVKLSDIGQYVVGRAWGRRKLAPQLSPGKTWEGAIGGIGLASVLVCGAMAWFSRGENAFGWPGILLGLAFTLSVAIAGLVGDLSESLLKRDAGLKDSSDWLPGFGGVLDLLDSLLLAGPVAYLWLALGVPAI